MQTFSLGKSRLIAGVGLGTKSCRGRRPDPIAAIDWRSFLFCTGIRMYIIQSPMRAPKCRRETCWHLASGSVLICLTRGSVSLQGIFSSAIHIIPMIYHPCWTFSCVLNFYCLHSGRLKTSSSRTSNVDVAERTSERRHGSSDRDARCIHTKINEVIQSTVPTWRVIVQRDRSRDGVLSVLDVLVLPDPPSAIDLSMMKPESELLSVF